MLHIPDIRMKDHRREGIGPAEHSGSRAVKDDEIGLNTDAENFEVGLARSEATAAGDQAKSLSNTHMIRGRDMLRIQHVVIELETGALQPEAGLGNHVC